MRVKSFIRKRTPLQHHYSLRIAFIFTAVLTSELLPVLLTWIHFPALSPRSPDEVRLLLASDPHLHLSGSPYFFVNQLVLFDGDSYLRTFFFLFLKHSKPTGIVLLGDLTNGDSSVSNWSFANVVRRVKPIFLSSTHIPCFMVAGDNDVDVIWNDLTFKQLVDRFQRAFVGFTETRSFGFVKLYGHTPWPNPAKFNHASEDDAVVIYVSHTPTITLSAAYFPESFSHLKPSLLLSGHDHVAYVLYWERSPGSTGKIHPLVPPNERQLFSEPFEANLTAGLSGGDFGSLFQLGVPSCSYRSGKPHLAAFGLLQVYRNRSIRYTLAPLPNRFHTLLVYPFTLFILCLCALCSLTPTAFLWRITLDIALLFFFYISCHLAMFVFITA